MSDDLHFIYKQEFWFASAFINTALVSGDQKSKEIEDLIFEKLGGLKEQDIFRKELVSDILEMVENLSIKCSWIPYIENFPYKDEDLEKEYDSLGYFQFEVEYYKENPEKKEKLNPLLIQQIPFIILDVLKGFTSKRSNKGLEIDTESPIYVFVTSNGTKPKEIDWTNDNINKFKKELGSSGIGSIQVLGQITMKLCIIGVYKIIYQIDYLNYILLGEILDLSTWLN